MQSVIYLNAMRKKTVKNDNKPSEYEIAGEKVTFGLCYICVMNINGTNMGYKCISCIRTYHGRCIKKLNIFDEETDKKFKCATCKKCKTGEA